MKIIVSHDVDHITASEHITDLIIPKFIIRTNIEFLKRKISVKEHFLRSKNILKNKWNNILETMDFDEKNNIPSTFFVGVNNGIGLNYNLELAEKWINKIINNGFDCGVHGIAYKTQEDINQEYNIFKNISGLDKFGIRMHYLRHNKDTYRKLSKAGYLFDSSEYDIKKHYKINAMYEFPLQIMEGYKIMANKRWQARTLKQALEITIKKINLSKQKNVEYLSILFHDRYFDDSFYTWKNWYIETINYCKSEGYKFVSYKQAIDNF